MSGEMSAVGLVSLVSLVSFDEGSGVGTEEGKEVAVGVAGTAWKKVQV